VPEDERIAPGEGFLDLANRVIFIGIRVIHEQRADFVRPHGGWQIAIVEPLTFVVLADRWTAHIDTAAAADDAIAAKRTGRLLQLLDIEDLAAMGAGTAAFSRNFQHVDGGDYAGESPPLWKNRFPDAIGCSPQVHQKDGPATSGGSAIGELPQPSMM